MKFLMNRIFYLFIFYFVAVASSSAITINESKRTCFNNNSYTAIPACEQVIFDGSGNDKVFLQLAKLYQEHGELEKAKETIERALSELDGKQKHKVASVKSVIDEKAWVENQDRVVDDSAELRIKCINFSRILPAQAVEACNYYLASNPDDQEVISHRYIALNKLTASNKSYQEIASNRNFNKETPETPSWKTVPIADTEPITTDNAAIVSDPETVADLKNELESVYALLELQKSQQIVTSSSNGNYKESGNRYALVIGNAAYPSQIGKLKNSVNDARDISKKLKDLDFKVSLVTDGNFEDMERSVTKLSKQLKPEDTVLFYYAGHGVAIQGENYLLPTKTNIKDVVDVRYKSLNLSFVLDRLDRGNTGVTVVVLDACRNNPFPTTRGAASQSGLIQSSGPVGTLIAYSTAPGDVAIDGTGRNGVYTKHLLSEISKPNIKLEDVFKSVRVAVESETQGQQVPWENSSLKSDFYFNYN